MKEFLKQVQKVFPDAHIFEAGIRKPIVSVLTSKFSIRKNSENGYYDLKIFRGVSKKELFAVLKAIKECEK